MSTPIAAFKPVTVAEAARVLGKTRKTLENWRNAGKMPSPVQIGGGVYWHPDVFYGWLEAQFKELPRSRADCKVEVEGNGAMTDSIAEQVTQHCVPECDPLSTGRVSDARAAGTSACSTASKAPRRPSGQYRDAPSAASRARSAKRLEKLNA